MSDYDEAKALAQFALRSMESCQMHKYICNASIEEVLLIRKQMKKRLIASSNPDHNQQKLSTWLNDKHRCIAISEEFILYFVLDEERPEPIWICRIKNIRDVWWASAKDEIFIEIDPNVKIKSAREHEIPLTNPQSDESSTVKKKKEKKKCGNGKMSKRPQT